MNGGVRLLLVLVKTKVKPDEQSALQRENCTAAAVGGTNLDSFWKIEADIF